MAHGETYEQFTQKFKPKKTTDDCYTPPAVMEAALGWVMAHAARPFRPEDVMRPFRPGGAHSIFPASAAPSLTTVSASTRA